MKIKLISYPKLNKPIKDYIDKISDQKIKETIFNRAFPSYNYLDYYQTQINQTIEKTKQIQIWNDWLKEEDKDDETGLITITFENRTIVKAGTVERLLERLTNEKFPGLFYSSNYYYYYYYYYYYDDDDYLLLFMNL